MYILFVYVLALQAKSVSDEFVYDEYRQKKIREKIDEQIASRVKTKVTYMWHFFHALFFF